MAVGWKEEGLRGLKETELTNMEALAYIFEEHSM